MKRALIISCFFQNISTSRPKLVFDYLSKYYETKVLTPDFVHSTKGYDHTVIKNIEKVHVPAYQKNFSAGRILSHLIFAIKAMHFIKKFKPSLIYICLPPNVAAWLATKVSKNMGIKCIVDVVDIWPNYNINSKGLIKVFYKTWGSFREGAIRNADAIILECELYINYVKNNKGLTVIPLAKKEKEEFTSINIKNINTDILYVAYLGAFSHSYDFDSFINILSKLKRRKIHLEIIGAGERKPEVLERLDHEGISFTDHGIVYDEAQKISILSKCHLGYNGFVKDAVVGQSYKSLDYLSMGIPLLNSLRADTWEVVQRRNIGFNFDPDNLSDVISRLDKHTFKDFTEMKKRARNAFEELYSWDIYCKSMDKILEEIGELNETANYD